MAEVASDASDCIFWKLFSFYYSVMHIFDLFGFFVWWGR
jgi:hypothetical protein